jgi:hypothetical protein
LADANAALWELRGLHSTILDERQLEARKFPLEGKERVMPLKVAGELRRRAVEWKPELATYVSIRRNPTKPETLHGLIEKMGAEGLQDIRGSTRVQGP